MAALTGPRKTASCAGNFIAIPIAAGETIYQGALVAINSNGEAVPASASENLTAAGCAINITSDGIVTAERGCWFFENDTASPVTQALVGKPCYMLDDQTVTASPTGSSIAGKVLGFEDGLVKVDTY